MEKNIANCTYFDLNALWFYVNKSSLLKFSYCLFKSDSVLTRSLKSPINHCHSVLVFVLQEVVWCTCTSRNPAPSQNADSARRSWRESLPHAPASVPVCLAVSRPFPAHSEVSCATDVCVRESSALSLSMNRRSWRFLRPPRLPAWKCLASLRSLKSPSQPQRLPQHPKPEREQPLARLQEKPHQPSKEESQLPEENPLKPQRPSPRKLEAKSKRELLLNSFSNLQQ